MSTVSKEGFGGLTNWDEEDVAAVIGLDEPAIDVVVDVDKEAVDATNVNGVSGDGRLVGCSLSSSNDISSSSLSCIFSIFVFKSWASIHKTFWEMTKNQLPFKT